MAIARPAGRVAPGQDPALVLAEMWAQRRHDRSERRLRLIDWSMRVPEPKTGTLDWARFPFQPELYARPEGEAVIKKGTQVGISAFLVRWTMYWADLRGLTSLYVFPKLKAMYDFSDARIRAAILASDYLQRRIPGAHVQNKGLKEIGLGFVYYRGSESETDLIAVDADCLALDEYDSLVHANIPAAERRISGSQFGYMRRVGVPTIPGFGLDALYEESDRRQWHVKCGHCGEWQTITFWENVDQALGIRVCRRCAASLEGALAAGEWVPEFPDREVRGYHVHRMLVPDPRVVPPIIKASRQTSPVQRQIFHNQDLGLAYAPEEGRLSATAIAAAQRMDIVLQPGAVTTNLVTMGVDVASARNLNVRISEHLDDERKRALHIGEVDSFDEVALLMERYGVNMACIDHEPEYRLAMKIAEMFPGRVYLVAYADGRMAKVMNVREEERGVTVRRVEAIDATFEMVRRQRNLLPAALPEGYAAQMMANVRVAQKDELGKVTVRYQATGPDDYAHAEVFDLVATEMFYWRAMVDEAEREVFSPLEEKLEFQRADFSAGRPTDTYEPGPQDEYSYGPEEPEPPPWEPT